MQAITHKAHSTPSSRNAARRSVQVCAVKQQVMSPPLQVLTSKLLTAGLATSLVLAGTPAGAAHAFDKLPDIIRETYSFVDSNKDGIITKSELVRTSQEYADEVEFPMPSDDTMEFSMRLFDLNADGKLTVDELLTSIVLDSAIDQADRAVDEDVYKVFDKNNDGFVDLAEFKAVTPDIGANGDAVKDYLFKRVDRLVDSDGKLSGDEFVNALTLFRTTILGY